MQFQGINVLVLVKKLFCYQNLSTGIFPLDTYVFTIKTNFDKTIKGCQIGQQMRTLSLLKTKLSARPKYLRFRNQFKKI